MAGLINIISWMYREVYSEGVAFYYFLEVYDLVYYFLKYC